MNPIADPRPKPPCNRDDALAILNRLRDAGHVAYFAGGCVRDTLLGLPAKDWDIATDAPPPRLRELFSSTQAVGAAFGVILVRHGPSVVEVATFRADGAYEDGRRPTSVRYTTAEEDAQRRDFTINGLFFDPIEDRVIDYVGGRDDLTARRIRAIGSPAERFAEDHLRLLRAVRFASRFSFEIEPKTSEAIRSLASRVKGISPERIAEELRLMLTPPTRNIAWVLLWNLGLGQQIFRLLPKVPAHLNESHSIFLSITQGEPISFSLALAAATLCVQLQADPSKDVLEFLDKPAISRAVRAVRQALRVSNDESDQMNDALLAIHPLLQSAPPTLAQKKRFLAMPTSNISRELLRAIADVGHHRDQIQSLNLELTRLADQDVAPAPLADGNDLIAAGMSPGPEFRRILDAVYDAQLEGTISTKAEALSLAGQLKAT